MLSPISFCQKRISAPVRCSPSVPVLNWHKILRIGAKASDAASLPHHPCAARRRARAACPSRIRGATIPTGSIESATAGKAALTTLEDPFVDRLVWRALKRGCGAVIACTPRAAVDCNRAEDDVDPSVIDGVRRGRVTARARGGLGIVPVADPAARLSLAPADHARSSSAIGSTRHTGPTTVRSRTRFAAARPFRLRAPHRLPFDAAAADGHCADHLRRLPRTYRRTPGSAATPSRSPRTCGFEAGLNDPFAGGHVIERHAVTDAGRPCAPVGGRSPLLSRRRRCASRDPASTASPHSSTRLQSSLAKRSSAGQFATAAE